MKAILRTLIVLALCVGSSFPLFAQDQLPTSPALERAVLVEEVEHDLRGALELYAELAQDKGTPDAIQRHAALRLGMAYAKLGDKKAAQIAFERASKGDDEVARLAGESLVDPGDDKERERLLREEARRLIDMVPNYSITQDISGSDATRRLIWIGLPAVPEIIRGIEAHRNDPPSPQKQVISNLAAVLWRTGGPEAEAYLDSMRGDPDPGLRRLVVDGLRGNNALDDGMVMIAQRYLTDPDPTGRVVYLALGGSGGGFHSIWPRYDVDAILAVVDSGVPYARTTALDVLRNGWDQLGHGGDDAPTMDRLVPSLERALDDVDPDVVQAAHGVLSKLGLQSRASRALLVDRFPRLRPDFLLQWSDASDDPTQDTAIAGLLPMIRELGLNSSSNSAYRDHSVTVLFTFYMPFLGRDSLELMLEAQHFGHVRIDNLMRWITETCNDQDAERLLDAVLREPELEDLLTWLSGFEFGAESWAALAQIAKRLELRFTRIQSARIDGQLYSVRIAMGRTATPEAVAYLSQILGKDPTPLDYRAVARALIKASLKRPESDVTAALCRALTLEVHRSGSSPDPGVERQLVFARLVELGDPRAIELLPEAARQGLSTTNLREGFSSKAPFFGNHSVGISLLTLRIQDGDELVYFHGYDGKSIAAVWDDLLSRPRGEEWNQSWVLIPSMFGADYETEERWYGVGLPGRYSKVPQRLVEVFSQRWTQRASEESGEIESRKLEGLKYLLDFARRGEFQDATTIRALSALRTACLQSKSPRIRRLAFDLLPNPPGKAGGEALLAALSDPDAHVARRAAERVFESPRPIPRELFLQLLSNSSEVTRSLAITHYARYVDGGASDLVKARVKDGAVRVRLSACEFLGTQADANSVPELLGALTDVNGSVRTAAADSLRAIRFYHDEKAHWDRVFAGTEVSANGAAGALLEQAGTESPREVRLLAIRSLGTLGVAETLPFLIKWTAEKDEELAAAARAAIERIHKQGD